MISNYTFPICLCTMHFERHLLGGNLIPTCGKCMPTSLLEDAQKSQRNCETESRE